MRPSVIFLALSVLDDTKMASRKVTTAAQLLPRPTPILTSKHLRLRLPGAIELNVRLPSSSIDAVVTKAKDAHAQAPVAIRLYGYGSLKEDDYKTSEQVLGSDGIRTSIR